MRPLYTLLVTKGPDKGHALEIRSDRVSVGTANDMDLVLSDRTVHARHFMVMFDEGGWKAVTYDPAATIVVDRRWQHPQSRERGARIFLGDSQILLFAGAVDLATAVSGARGLDFDAETLRDDAVNQVRDRPVRFRADMTGKAEPVTDPRNRKPPKSGPRPAQSLPEQGSAVFSGKAGMMRLPETIDQGRRSQAPPSAQAPRSARATWEPASSSKSSNAGPIPQNRALVKGQTISLTDTAIQALPSQSRDLVVLHEKDGAFAAELRILATRMEDLRSRLGYKSFLVTSSGQGDGKTVTASNLALVMSEDSERRIALVDANFRNPRAADLFNLDKRRGLLSALSGELPLAQCVARVIGRNLVVLHAGGEHTNPASIISSHKFKSLLAELYQAVDFMIVDAPAALPFADVTMLTQHVDAVLMVGSAHLTKRTQLDKALETVGRGRVVGSIFMHRSKKSVRASRRANGA